MIKKIISGGQTGADIGALRAAKSLGLATGGYMPHGFLTELGPKPDWAETFGLEEHSSSRYAPRTQNNVLASDGTLIIGKPSAGSALTRHYCENYAKPLFQVRWTIEQGFTQLASPAFAQWLSDNKIQTLNVAGNRESINPFITEETRFYLLVNLGPPLRTSRLLPLPLTTPEGTSP